MVADRDSADVDIIIYVIGKKERIESAHPYVLVIDGETKDTCD